MPRRLSLSAIHAHIERCSLAELRRLDAWLHGLIVDAEVAEIERPLKGVIIARVVVEERATRNGTFRLELVRCGKKTCNVCRGGPAHGPYWYVYWKDGRRTRSQYIGKKLKPWRPPAPQAG